MNHDLFVLPPDVVTRIAEIERQYASSDWAIYTNPDPESFPYHAYCSSGCSGTCRGSCSGSCVGSCQGDCSGGCTGSCRCSTFR